MRSIGTGSTWIDPVVLHTPTTSTYVVWVVVWCACDGVDVAISSTTSTSRASGPHLRPTAPVRTPPRQARERLHRRRGEPVAVRLPRARQPARASEILLQPPSMPHPEGVGGSERDHTWHPSPGASASPCSSHESQLHPKKAGCNCRKSWVHLQFANRRSRFAAGPSQVQAASAASAVAGA